MKEAAGNIRWVLRIEGVAILTLSSIAFAHCEASWTLFAILFLVPDFSLIGYLLGSKTGAIAYNITHSLIGPLICIGAGLLSENSLTIAIGLIWSAHIGFDRGLGYGLKYQSGFRYTHLGMIGK
ncbi:DUF4260 domain-containing protein [Marinomonas transparens]|uniref:DUF4260 domain-containing protein n=1 Tax=Marinomonas transparens TaxID=2795388 RepID=A0A934JX04_9GAMM|nr:DUF4260 domain-containing protein [Marinomonas transparens]MBJ7539762.1 DUF4260 domain-containing protein [Marinomonas transparens]